MNSHQITWEDDDCNRHIQFSISYEMEGSAVKINAVTPTAVSFTCPESKATLRTIRVHTNAGRQMLANHFANSGHLEQVAEEIASLSTQA
ncbi:MAG: hypothetical protein KDB14_21085 [Planctomycetales bacterium]|nr:hypothetical protein [Planctomycetales bacterium]